MKPYRFTIILNGLDSYDDDLADKIGSVCNDSLLSISNYIVTLDFDREAESKEEAISSAITQLRGLGLNPKLIDRATEKQLSRNKDKEDLISGKKTREQLREENSLIRISKIHLEKVKAPR